MTERLRYDLRCVLVLSLPLLGISDTEAFGEYLADGLERHALNVGVEEDDEDPAYEADTAVEAEGPRGCHALHHCDRS